RIGVNGGVGSTDNTIGGVLGENSRNVISGNGLTGFANQDFGVWIEGNGVLRTVLQGNYIGLGSDGATAPGNKNDGVFVGINANNTVIGGAALAARNVISANGSDGNGYGVAIWANNALVQNNYIGLDANGVADPDYQNELGWQWDGGAGNQW